MVTSLTPSAGGCNVHTPGRWSRFIAGDRKEIYFILHFPRPTPVEMFNSLLREFDEDPFFSSSRDPFQAHNTRVQQMMRSFSEPFGRDFMPSLTGGRERGHVSGGQLNTSMVPREDHRDNDPKHTSRLCKGYLTKKESDGVLHQMSWPAQSPDLNPIEMFWDELDRRVKEKQPTSAQVM
uniref:Tc1-like transposase DDE domain-containing protein n=1 Tax=Oncorhynchus tshawytscha TaxID=74940 RepID=A0AAZ3RRK8_ONCTS